MNGPLAPLIVLKAIARSNARIHRLDLGSDGSSYDGAFLQLSPHDRVLAKAAMEKMTSVRISLNARDSDAFSTVLNEGCCARFLSWANRVESITVADNQIYAVGFDEFPPDIISLEQTFGRYHYPWLKILVLESFCIFPEDLMKLLERLQATLEILFLSQGHLCVGSWYQIFSKLRQTQHLGALRKFVPYCLSRAGGDKIFFAYDCDQALSKPNSFIFEKGSWSPDLPKGLLDVVDN